MLEDFFVKARFVGGKSEDIEKSSGRSSFPG